MNKLGVRGVARANLDKQNHSAVASADPKTTHAIQPANV